MAARLYPSTNKEANNISKDAIPQYWEMLTEDEKKEYRAMHQEFVNGAGKKNRNNRVDSFDYVLEIIKKYTERGDERDWRRFLVCGVCWLDNAIAINTRQLRILISKCKSSINGSLLKMGYSTNTSHSESWKVLYPKIPFLKDHFTELRQWTIRFKSDSIINPKGDIIDKTQHFPSKSPLLNLAVMQEYKPEKVPERPKTPVSLVEIPEREVHTPCIPLKFRSKMVRVQTSV